jgi:hypothetical protein
MRSRLVPFLIAAVIWAPGWYGRGQPQDQRGGNLAARVLAPTVNEGEIRKLAVQQKHQLSGRQAKRWGSDITIKAVATLGLGTVTLVGFWVLGFYSGPVLPHHSLLFRFSRAPPATSPGR